MCAITVLRFVPAVAGLIALLSSSALSQTAVETTPEIPQQAQVAPNEASPPATGQAVPAGPVGKMVPAEQTKDSAKPAAAKGAESTDAKTASPAAAQSPSPRSVTVPQSLRLEQLPGFESYTDITSKMRQLSEGGRIYKIRWSKTGRSIGFTLNGQKKQFNIDTGAITDRTENLVDKSLKDPVKAGPKVQRAKQVTSEMSPSKKWTAIYRDNNIVLKPKSKQTQSLNVTVDGKGQRRFGTCCWVYGEELDQQTAMWWSPDSRKLAFYEVDETGMEDYYLTIDNTATYNKLETLRYPKAGDANPKVALHIFDIDTRQTLKVNVPGKPDQYLYNVNFSPSGDDLIFSVMSRRQDELQVMAADVRTGETRVIVSEKQATWQTTAPVMRFLSDGKTFVWETERTGWKNYELRDLSGKKIVDLTEFKEFPCNKIELIDEAAGLMYYSAYSDSTNPYNLQLHRCKLDGTSQQRITTANQNHSSFQISPNHQWLVAVRERFDMPRSTALYNCEEGKEVAVLRQSKNTLAKEMNLPAPEIFEFMANDGITKLFGTLHKPSNFDPAKKYPLLIDVYGGPQSNGIRNSWSPANQVCEFGFLIAKIGNRGTVKRGKAFESANFRQLGGPDLDDQVSAVEFLSKRPYVDGGRVGIYGHSYGGYLSALAILKYPDVFQVAVSGAPVTDWKNYDTIYTERYMQTPRENSSGYKQSSCSQYANRLKGNLLLVHGLIDDNVHPSNTWQLAKELQNKDKRFDMMIYPGFRHGVDSTYNAVRWEYFFKHLRPDLN